MVERGRGRERVSRLARRDEISIPREAVLEDGARKKPKEGCSDRGARTHFRSPPLFQTPAENVRIYNCDTLWASLSPPPSEGAKAKDLFLAAAFSRASRKSFLDQWWKAGGGSNSATFFARQVVRTGKCISRRRQTRNIPAREYFFLLFSKRTNEKVRRGSWKVIIVLPRYITLR